MWHSVFIMYECSFNIILCPGYKQDGHFQLTMHVEVKEQRFCKYSWWDRMLCSTQEISVSAPWCFCNLGFHDDVDSQSQASHYPKFFFLWTFGPLSSDWLWSLELSTWNAKGLCGFLHFNLCTYGKNRRSRSLTLEPFPLF